MGKSLVPLKLLDIN